MAPAVASGLASKRFRPDRRSCPRPYVYCSGGVAEWSKAAVLKTDFACPPGYAVVRTVGMCSLLHADASAGVRWSSSARQHLWQHDRRIPPLRRVGTGSTRSEGAGDRHAGCVWPCQVLLAPGARRRRARAAASASDKPHTRNQRSQKKTCQRSACSSRGPEGSRTPASASAPTTTSTPP